MSLRLQGLFRLKMLDELVEEAAVVLSMQAQFPLDSSLEGLSDGAPHPMFDAGTTVALHMLLLEVKLLTGRNEEAMEQQSILRNKLSAVVRAVDMHGGAAPVAENAARLSIRSDDIQRYSWYWKVFACIINTSVRLRLWRHAVAELSRLLSETKALRGRVQREFAQIQEGDDLMTADEVSVVVNTLLGAEVTLQCRLSRVFLQVMRCVWMSCMLSVELLITAMRCADRSCGRRAEVLRAGRRKSGGAGRVCGQETAVLCADEEMSQRANDGARAVALL